MTGCVGMLMDSWIEQCGSFTGDRLKLVSIASPVIVEKALAGNRGEIDSHYFRLEAIFQAMPVALMVLDPSGQVIEMNSTALSLHGYQCLDEAYCRLAVYPQEYEFRTLDDQPLALAEWPLAKALRGEQFNGVEVVFVRRDMQTRQILSSSSIAVDGPDGEPPMTVLVLRDITDSKRAEETITSSVLHLKQSNRDLEDFATTASHDLQEPLRKIEAFANLLTSRSNNLDSDQLEYLDHMQRAAHRMRLMVDELLQLSRVGAGQISFSPVDLNQVAIDALANLEAQIRNTGGIVEIEHLPEIYGDATQLTQLFQNLVSNALKFHQPGTQPVVRVSSHCLAPSFVEILVADNGIGFNPEQAEIIFQPFKRLVGRSQYEGCGMGLAICRKIVERHRGKIAAVSKSGAGSTFVITLPVSQPDSPGIEP
jgi:signal transduction histidine kinase